MAADKAKAGNSGARTAIVGKAGKSDPKTGQEGKPAPKVFTLAAFTLAAPCGSRLQLHVIIAAWRVAAAACRKWRKMEIDDPGEEAPHLRLRTPSKVHLPKQWDGVTPPPFHGSGWADTGNGWQKHRRALEWLRKPKGFGGPAYFYLPDDSLWMTMPNGLFMCVDMCSESLAATVASCKSSLLQSCFSSWRCQASITRQWRYKISLFGMSAADSTTQSHDPYASAEDARFTSSDAQLEALDPA